jgi:hypothetical protein
MPYFTKRIKTDRGDLNFYFNRIYTAEGLRFHISVIDKDKKSHAFNVQEDNGKWFLVNAPNCPYWIADLEKQFEKAIIEHLKDKKETNI